MSRLISYLSVIMVLFALTGHAYAEAEGGEGGSDKPHPDFAYVQLDPVNLPIITAKGLTQQVTLSISIEVGFEDQDKVKSYKPRLTDAYIQDLYGAIGAGYALMKGNVVDVVQIKQRLTTVTDKVLGPDIKMKDVLLQVIQQRTM